jgi:hypothetical protein
MHVILCSPCIYKWGGQGSFQERTDRRQIYARLDSSRESVPHSHILRHGSSSLSHQPVTYNIPDVKKQLKLDYEASSSINIK